jgi:hypothetical protein
LADDARFCVACGAPFPNAQPGSSAASAEVVAAPPETGTVHRSADDVLPSRPAARRVAKPRAVADPLPVAADAPTVPLAAVIAGAVVLLVILLVLLLSA